MIILIVTGLVAVLPVVAFGAGDTGEASVDGGTMAGAASWTLSFHDGSNNGFEVSVPVPGEAGRLAYRPVRPEESSSGIYSGGEPRTVIVPASEAARIQTWVDRLAGSMGDHVEKRVMGSGLFSIRAGESRRRFLLGPGDELTAFAGFLRSLLTRGPEAGP